MIQLPGERFPQRGVSLFWPQMPQLRHRLASELNRKTHRTWSEPQERRTG